MEQNSNAISYDSKPIIDDVIEQRIDNFDDLKDSETDIEFNPNEKEQIIEVPADLKQTVAGSINLRTWMVVTTELCERFTYYGASLMFQQYMRNVLKIEKGKAVAINRGFQFTSYFFTLICAVIADQWLGKFKTVLIFSLWYLIGLVLLTISSAPFSLKGGFGLAGFIISSYLFIGVGTGGIKSNVSSFMGEQIEPGYTPTKQPGVYIDSKLTVERAFRYFYWAINTGALMGMMICPQVAKNVSYPVAYMIPAIFFAVGILVFVSGYPRYIKKKPTGTVLGKVIHCMKYARHHRQEGSGHWLDGALDAPGQEWDNEFVVGLKRSICACKVFLFYPLYWALYNNMSDNFINQGMTMKRPNWLSVDQLNVINSLMLVIMIPVFDKFIFPFFRKCGLRLGPIVRITIGYGIVVAGFIYVTILQKVIYKTGPWYDFTKPGTPEGAFNNISVYYQIVAYVAVAMSEIFASVTGLEYAFSQAPDELKSVLSALFLFTNCGGALIGMVLSIWGGDPQVLYVFAAETILLGVMGIIFYFCFRHYDDESEQQQKYN